VTQLKIATWNIENMNNYFSGDKPKEDADSDNHFQQIRDVILGIDADILGIQEGPNKEIEMNRFLEKHLPGKYKTVIASPRDRHPINNTSYSDRQISFILYRDDPKFTHNQIERTEHDGPFADWRTTIDPEHPDSLYFHHRLPVEMDFTYDDGTKNFTVRLLCLHTKSKKPNYAKPGDAKNNRRILLAQAIKIRDYIDSILDNDLNAPVIVVGDLNDGIGLDPFEYVLGGDFVGILTGSVRMPYRLFDNACKIQILENLQEPGKHYSISFNADGEIQKILIDHILFSPYFKNNDLIEESTGKIREDLRNSFPNASDHTPIEAVFSF